MLTCDSTEYLPKTAGWLLTCLATDSANLHDDVHMIKRALNQVLRLPNFILSLDYLIS